MGKYRSGRRVAEVTGRHMMAKVANLVKGGVMQEPSWFQAAKRSPPPVMPFSAPKPPEIVFPEDRLATIYMRRNPEHSSEHVNESVDAARAGRDKSRQYLFVNLWQKYIEKGMPEEDAYTQVDKEFRAVEEKAKAEKEAHLRQQIEANNVPQWDYYQSLEEPYVQEALDFQKRQYTAKRRKEAMIEEMVQKKTELSDAETPAAGKQKGGAKGKKKK
mmetsp:Transcript_36746/g.86468  ORF Transcript_36746/g.86468 Transcript_36746/m.86468 type:complete len:216 (-) Transcript_36746:104-751(-)